MRIENTDIKSLALKKIGVERAFDKLERNTLDQKTFPIGGDYELFAVDFGSGEERYLSMTCPSKGQRHVEGVHPDCKTVDQALGWSMYEDRWDQEGYQYEEPAQQS
jgi:hypothetical protein